jgi:hypothetical protein
MIGWGRREAENADAWLSPPRTDRWIRLEKAGGPGTRTPYARQQLGHRGEGMNNLGRRRSPLRPRRDTVLHHHVRCNRSSSGTLGWKFSQPSAVQFRPLAVYASPGCCPCVLPPAYSRLHGCMVVPRERSHQTAQTTLWRPVAPPTSLDLADPCRSATLARSENSRPRYPPLLAIHFCASAKSEEKRVGDAAVPHCVIADLRL